MSQRWEVPDDILAMSHACELHSAVAMRTKPESKIDDCIGYATQSQ
jgi:hypothetical protein